MKYFTFFLTRGGGKKQPCLYNRLFVFVGKFSRSLVVLFAVFCQKRFACRVMKMFGFFFFTVTVSLCYRFLLWFLQLKFQSCVYEELAAAM